MVEGSLYLKLGDGGITHVPMHWRSQSDDFARWAVRHRPDAVEITLTIWCETALSRRTPCGDDLDERPYDEVIDGPGWCIQDQPTIHWVKLHGFWWVVTYPQTSFYYDHPEEEYSVPPRLADFIPQDCPLMPPSLDEIRKWVYRGFDHEGQ
jgi:hypothetical protein